MTGCYPRRVGMHEDFTGHWVLIPRSRRGLNPKELTIAEALKTKGYSTACVGKWHLGFSYPYRPQDRGFNEVFVHGGGGVGQMEDYFANSLFDTTFLHNGMVASHLVQQRIVQAREN